ncbi:MAG: response regulator transcription factor [Actinomycetales bacterium]|nr:response regulator transcription factor [Actinomycetales bacterium]
MPNSSTKPKPRILVVDDEVGLATEISVALRAAGYSTRVETEGTAALKMIEATRPELVLLDIMLPGMDGVSIGRKAVNDYNVPVIFMTALDSLENKVEGLNLGADDYVTKPILIGELLLRVRAVLRRTGAIALPLQVGDLELVEDEYRASNAGVDLGLTKTEFRLLAELANARGRVLTKNFLLTQVWGYDAYEPNLVEVHMSSLRKKLNAVELPDLITTKRGIGYLIK